MLTFDEPSHRYAWNGVPVPGVTSVLAPLSNFGMVDPDVLQAAIEFGHAVHKATELDDLGQLDVEDLDPSLVPYLQGWKKFSREWSVEWVGIEERVYHPKLRYAGTLDRRGLVTNPQTKATRRAVVDIKSSTSLYASVGPQLAAYARAVEPDLGGGTLRLALQLKGDGTYVAKEYTDPTDWAAFASLLTLRTWCARNNVIPRF